MMAGDRRGGRAGGRRARGAVGAVVLAGVLAGGAPAVLGERGDPPGTVEVVALGDSVPAGTACDCRPFPQLYGDLLARRERRPVRVHDDAVAGLTAAGLAERLADPDGRTARDVRRAGVVLVTVGANDLAPALDRWTAGGCDRTCYRPAVAAMAASLRQVLASVRRLDLTPGARVLVTTYWNVFQDGDGAVAARGPRFPAWSGAVTRAANTAVRAAARAAGAVCVDLAGPFERSGDPTPLLAADADHPNARGHALIARTLVAATPEP